ncbi:unnamed protein product [Haemonchus placei]|uniref:Uncharacterized protein n=1 Tax=Haemonchus placei TaxID=6290 RepID=A0A3P7TK51_HAEPC|nr:unnamed protein product [Haemonchus placei]
MFQLFDEESLSVLFFRLFVFNNGHSLLFFLLTSFFISNTTMDGTFCCRDLLWFIVLINVENAIFVGDRLGDLGGCFGNTFRNDDIIDTLNG